MKEHANGWLPNEFDWYIDEAHWENLIRHPGNRHAIELLDAIYAGTATGHLWAICGYCGNGKTFLMEAFRQRMHASRPVSTYGTNGDAFCRWVRTHGNLHPPESVAPRLLQFDLFYLDEIQFLHRKPMMCEWLLHILQLRVCQSRDTVLMCCHDAADLQSDLHSWSQPEQPDAALWQWLLQSLHPKNIIQLRGPDEEAAILHFGSMAWRYSPGYAKAVGPSALAQAAVIFFRALKNPTFRDLESAALGLLGMMVYQRIPATGMNLLNAARERVRKIME